VRRGDLGLLAVGVVAVSTSAPLLREADAPALALASWRNLLAALVLGALLVARRRTLAPGPADRRLVGLAGLFLAGHFATWIPSVERTTVASSVALVSTQPVWAALLARRRGEPVANRAWWGIGLALAGVVVLTGVDLRVDADALAGDLLALAGGALAAAYVTAGAEVRRNVPNATYAFGAYAVAGVATGLATLAGGDAMAGFDGRTWLVIVALTAGPQLLGHTVFNQLLPSVGATVVSVAVLLEVVGAALLAWWWQGEVPPPGAVPAAALLLSGIALVVRSATVTTRDEVVMG